MGDDAAVVTSLPPPLLLRRTMDHIVSTAANPPVRGPTTDRSRRRRRKRRRPVHPPFRRGQACKRHARRRPGSRVTSLYRGMCVRHRYAPGHTSLDHDMRGQQSETVDLRFPSRLPDSLCPKQPWACREDGVYRDLGATRQRDQGRLGLYQDVSDTSRSSPGQHSIGECHPLERLSRVRKRVLGRPTPAWKPGQVLVVTSAAC